MRRVGLLCLLAACGVAASGSDVSSDNTKGYPKRDIKVILPPEGCTTIVVDPAASSDGGMATHTNDCTDCDFRMSLVPARDWPEGSMRPVAASRFAYPRYVGNDRGSNLRSELVDRSIFNWGETAAIASIPQVPHTYAYLDNSYGIMNENGVAIGESTCAARIVAAPIYDGGHALFDIAELGRIALERARTAREAVQIMGDLGERYGYYGSEWKGDYALGEAAEALSVVDGEEAWIFHMLADTTGRSAIWAAQRVPRGHLAVVANAFIIQHIDFDDHNNFMYSKNILTQAIENDFWHPSWGPFNFAAVYGEQVFFEVYCSRRTWRIFSFVAPSLHLQPNVTIAELPFSVKPERLLSKQDLFTIQRDHYEGTEFDLTKGLAAGPYGNPNRFDRSDHSGVPNGWLYQGTFERAISLFRTAYSFVSLSRPYLPTQLSALWFSPSVPHASFFMPLYPFANDMPSSLQQGSLYALSHDCVWWAAQAINNHMNNMYNYMLPDVQQAQLSVQQQAEQQAKQVELQALSLIQKQQESAARSLVTQFQNDNAAKASAYWWSLFDHLLTRFHDGQRVDDFHAETFAATSMFYPFEWLQAVGFWQTPIDLNQTTWSYTRPMPNRPHSPTSPSTSTQTQQQQQQQQQQQEVATPAVGANRCAVSTSLADARLAKDETGWAVHMSSLAWVTMFVLFACLFTGLGMLLERHLHKRSYLPIPLADE